MSFRENQQSNVALPNALAQNTCRHYLKDFFPFSFFEEVQEEEGEIKEIRSDKVKLSQQNSEA